MLSLLTALWLAASSPNMPPAAPGECKWVHGRFAIYNGAGVRRIWVIGTHRIIDLDNVDDIPPAIARYEQSNSVSMADALYGDFYVCAVQPSRPGRMQLVHLRQTKKLIFRGKPYPPK